MFHLHVNTPSSEIEKAVYNSVKNRKPSEGWGGNPYTLTSLSHIHPCVRRVIRPWYVKDVLFIVMASSINIDRAKAIKDTWGKSLTSNLLLVGDKNIPKIGMITLDMLNGKIKKEDAPHRTLQGLKYAINNPMYHNYSWIFMVDDDTWVNIYELPSLLMGWDIRVPFLMSFIWHFPGNDRTWPSGASMLVTRAAAIKLAENIYTETCPFDTHNDITIVYCT